MKRLLLSLVLTISTMLSTVWAYDFSAVVSSGQRLYFNINSDTVSVSVTYPASYFYSPYNGYTRPTGDLVIPSSVTYNGTTYQITIIDCYAFYYCGSLTSVTIPNSITSIGAYAFSRCDNLATLNFNAINCSNFEINSSPVSSNPFGQCPISTINIGDSVQRIPAYFAYQLTSLSSITIPNSVTYIGESAFYNCHNLTTLNFNAINCGNFSRLHSFYYPFYNCNFSTINIGDSVQRIPAYFAYNNSALSAITIPNSVTYIGHSAFEGCTGLTSITIPNNVTSIGSSTFQNCSSLTSITIPNNVTSIGSSAFQDCSSLTSITIPNNVTSIGSSAFQDCSSLTSVTIPNSVTTIENSAFYGCSSLTTLNFNAINCSDFNSNYHPFSSCPISTINIGDSVQRIPAYFAYSRSSLSAITIPNSVTSIGYSAFSSCSSLTILNFNAINCSYPNNINYVTQLPFYDCPISTITIGDSVQLIPAYFASNLYSLGTLTIGNGVTTIEHDAFYNCGSLATLNFNAINCSNFSSGSNHPFNDCPISTITIGDSVQRIPAYFAYNKTALTSVTIGNSVTSIGSSAFYNCSSLTSVTIPNSIDTIRNYTFYNCSSLSSIITIPNSVTYIGESAFSGCSSLTSLTIPNSVTSIGESAFRGCSGLTSVTIPNSIDTIRNYTFGRCSNLTSITIPNSVTYIGESAFRGCSGLTSVTIPNSVTSIGSSAFQDCSSLTSITIPNSVTSIGSSAFRDCSGLTSVSIPNSVTYIRHSAFYGCSNLATLNFNAINCGNFSSYYTTTHNDYTYYYYPPFYNCPISTINIGDSVQRIPAYFAYNLDSVSSITIPNSVTSIGDNAFGGCSSLTTIIIPNNVTSIGDSTFNGCSNLRDVTSLATTPPSLGSSCFSAAGILKVPCGSLNSYRYSSWLDYFTIMEEICDNITITVSSANENMGTVSGGGEYAFGTQVTITATPNQGYRFVRWTDDNTNNPRTITATTNATYIATFEEGTNNITITVTSANENMGTVSGGGEYAFGAQVTITAIPNQGYRFVCWNDGNTDNPRTITATANATYIATFEEGVGIENIDVLDNLTFYPNPTKGFLNFNMEVEKVEVMDMMGKMVMQFCNVNEINIGTLPKGVYCLKLSYRDKAIIHKIIKE